MSLNHNSHHVAHAGTSREGLLSNAIHWNAHSVGKQGLENRVANAENSSLDLSHDKMTDKDVKVLSELLKHDTSITNLNLGHGDISDDGAVIYDHHGCKFLQI